MDLHTTVRELHTPLRELSAARLLERSATIELGFGAEDALPKLGLLSYIELPNGVGANAGKYILPTGSASLFTALGAGFWYTDINTPIAHTMAEILALVGINEANVLASATKGLAIYEVGTSAGTLAKAKKFLKIEQEVILPPYWKNIDGTNIKNIDGSNIDGTNIEVFG